MHISLREPDDRTRLQELIHKESNAKQRDRYRAALLALDGDDAPTLMSKLGRSRTFVQTWVYAYRDGGIGAMAPGKPTGAPPKLSREQEEAFKRRMLAGPTEADGGLCTLRGRDAVAILGREFGVNYTLQGAYDLMRRLNLSCLKPRPRHRKADPEAQRQWLERAPLLSTR